MEGHSTNLYHEISHFRISWLAVLREDLYIAIAHSLYNDEPIFKDCGF